MRFVFRVKGKEFPESKIHDILDRCMQLIFYNVKCKVEMYVQTLDYKNKISKVVFICSDGIIKDTLIVAK